MRNYYDGHFRNSLFAILLVRSKPFVSNNTPLILVEVSAPLQASNYPGALTKEEEEYFQPWIVKDVKRLVEHLEELKQLKTRTPEQLDQMKEIRDLLVRSIKDVDNMYPDWEQLD